MKSIALKILLVAFLAFVFSIDDFAWPSDRQFEVLGYDGHTIEVLAYDNAGSDAECANFWWEIRNLFDRVGPGAVVSIGNFGSPSIWIPSKTDRITFCYAECMNSPWEEYGEFDTFEDCEAACLEAVYDGPERYYDD